MNYTELRFKLVKSMLDRDPVLRVKVINHVKKSGEICG